MLIGPKSPHLGKAGCRRESTLQGPLCCPCETSEIFAAKARVFGQPLDGRCPAAEQQTVLCASGWR